MTHIFRPFAIARNFSYVAILLFPANASCLYIRTSVTPSFHPFPTVGSQPSWSFLSNGFAAIILPRILLSTIRPAVEEELKKVVTVHVMAHCEFQVVWDALPGWWIRLTRNIETEICDAWLLLFILNRSHYLDITGLRHACLDRLSESRAGQDL